MAGKNSIIVENVHTFRRAQSTNEVCALPEISQKRKMTDIVFLIIFAICIISLLSLMIYALINSDIQRVIHGYDKCGNVCGQKNTPVDGIACSGQDMTNKPILLYEYTIWTAEYVGTTCVDACQPPLKTSYHRCAPSDIEMDFFSNAVDKVNNEGVGLTILSFVSLGLSICLLLVFRYFVKEFVWTMLILSVLAMFAVTGYIWYSYSTDSSLIYLAIVFTVISIIFALFIWILTIKINLIIYFFEEAVRIVFAMPLILLEPILTFISIYIVMGLFVYTFLLMSSAGTLQEDEHETGRYKYVPNGAMIFPLWWSIVVILWMIQFILACQHMIIAGAVATYYFARNKLIVVAPIYSSFYNLIRYHLGTVAFGSLLITILNTLNAILQALSQDNRLFYFFYYCFQSLEDYMKYYDLYGIYCDSYSWSTPLSIQHKSYTSYCIQSIKFYSIE